MARQIGYGLNHGEDVENITAAEASAVLTGIPAGGALAVQIVSSALSATITFEVTLDGTNWTPIGLTPVGTLTEAALVTTATANGLWVTRFPVAVSGFRARCSAFTSATAARVFVRWSAA